MWELTKSFRFEAAHALSGTTLGEASQEIHGHSFRAEVTVRGTPDPVTGMVLDLGLLQQSMAAVQKMLDHKLLNKIEAPRAPNAGKPVALRLGAGSACGKDHPREHLPRQLRRKLHLLWPAGLDLFLSSLRGADGPSPVELDARNDENLCYPLTTRNF